MKPTEQIDRIREFITPLGFTLEQACLPRTAVVPGVQLDGECRVLFDPHTLIKPGDILHEVGHLAVIPAQFRCRIRHDVDACLEQIMDTWFAEHAFIETGQDGFPVENAVSRGLLQCGEQEAQAWSYAAAVACGVPPASVFHSKAYGGSGAFIRTGLSVGRHLGIHGLAAGGMCVVREFPTMRRWVQV